MWRFLNAVFDLAGEVFAEVGVYPKSLSVLFFAKHLQYPAEIARALSMPPPTLSAILRELEAAELIRREIDTRDRRRFVISLTARGETVLAAGQAAINDALGAKLAALTADEQRALKLTMGLLDQMLPNSATARLVEQRVAESEEGAGSRAAKKA